MSSYQGITVRRFCRVILGVCLITASVWSATAYAQYQPGPSVDARTLDIGGVKIGMSFEEAISAIVDRYDVERDDIKVQTFPSEIDGVMIELPTALELTSDEGAASIIGLPNSGWVLTVAFFNRLVYDKDDPVEVNRITYEMAWTTENQVSLREASLEKYGPATADQGAMGFQWCDQPSSSWANCESEAELGFSGTTLQLTDSRPYRLWLEAKDKAASKKPKI